MKPIITDQDGTVLIGVGKPLADADCITPEPTEDDRMEFIVCAAYICIGTAALFGALAIALVASR